MLLLLVTEAVLVLLLLLGVTEAVLLLVTEAVLVLLLLVTEAVLVLLLLLLVTEAVRLVELKHKKNSFEFNRGKAFRSKPYSSFPRQWSINYSLILGWKDSVYLFEKQDKNRGLEAKFS